MKNLAKNPVKKNSVNMRVFNSCPINLSTVNIDRIEQINFKNYSIHSLDSMDVILNSLKSSNPQLNFGIKGDKFYENEESELVNKPESDVWSLKDLGNGNYSILVA